MDGQTTATVDAAFRSIPLDHLRPSTTEAQTQRRKYFDKAKLQELAESIAARGVLQPIVVRQLDGFAGASGHDPAYEIVAGERRFLASQIAKRETIQAVVLDLDDEGVIEVQLIENLQREDLNPLEEAQGLQRLIGEFHLTHEQAAQAVGRSRSAASNLMRLLHLSEPVQKLLMAGDIEMGHARALLSLTPAEQILCANEIVGKGLSVRDTERLVARRAAGAESPKRAGIAEKSRDIARLEEQLADRLTAPVEIRLKRRGASNDRGEIAIAFRSLDELNGVLDKLGLTDR